MGGNSLNNPVFELFFNDSNCHESDQINELVIHVQGSDGCKDVQVFISFKGPLISPNRQDNEHASNGCVNGQFSVNWMLFPENVNPECEGNESQGS